jgi:hypothetical protein
MCVHLRDVEEGNVDQNDLAANLNNLSTNWTLVFQAYSDDPDAAAIAARQLMCRYAGAVHRYLLKALDDADAAEELDQEFASRFLRGDFRNCDPMNGRFRDFVKRALQTLINDHYQRKRPTIAPASHAPALPAVRIGGSQFDQEFLASWRNDLLERAWNGLVELEKNTGQPYYSVLRSKFKYPDLQSAELAGKLTTALKRSFSAGAVRQILQHAREKYVDYLLTEVRASLLDPTRDDLEQELIDLDLMHYCRPFMKRGNASPPGISPVARREGTPDVRPRMQAWPGLSNIGTAQTADSSASIDKILRDDTVTRERFRAEANKTTQLKHPEIAPIQPVTIRRHTDVSFPAEVQAGKVYNLRVQLVPATTVLPSGEVCERPRPHAHDATLDLLVSAGSTPDAPPPPINLTVGVAAENFEVEGQARAEMSVPLEGKSSAVQFELRGLEIGPGRIMIDFAQNGMPAGSVDLAPVVVGSGAAVRLAAGIAPTSFELSLDLETGPARACPDVVLKVFEHRLSGHPGRLQFVLSSNHPGLADLPVLDGDLGTLDLRADVAGWVGEQLRVVGTLAEKPEDSAGNVERTLASVGFNLFDQLLPAAAKEVCWTFRERGVKTLMVLSDDPHIPWELVKPFQADPVTGAIVSEDAFWGESYALTHWLRGRPPIPRLTIARVLGVAAAFSEFIPAPIFRSEPTPSGFSVGLTRDMVGVNATSTDTVALPGPSDEATGSTTSDALTELVGVNVDIVALDPVITLEEFRRGPESATVFDEELGVLRVLEAIGARVERLPALRLSLRQAFEEGSFDLLHLVSHGSFGGPEAGDATAVYLDDGAFTAAELSPRMAAALRRVAPLVIFNTCHCGRTGFSLTRLGSWGAHLVRLGCGAFIGALWPVSDRAALAFARAFYEQLASNRPIGEAVRLARLRVREQFPGDPTWLAYCCFADPTACLEHLPRSKGHA